MRYFPLFSMAAMVAAAVLPATAQVPQLLNYQGRVKVSGADFSGTGQFKFSLVNGGGTTTFWSNDGTGLAGSQPTAGVSLAVSGGLYNVLLGDATVPNMTAITAGVFTNSDVRLRVWFSDGVNGWQQMSPDQRVAAVGYALMADNVKDGAVTAAKLADGAVTQSKMAAGSVTAAALAPDAVKTNLAASGEGTVPAGAGLVSTSPSAPGLLAAGYQRVGTLNSGDDWTAIPEAGARDAAASVWTGTEFLIWGDGDQGFRYNPTTGAWTAMTTANQPLPRRYPLAVWSGTEMIVWGGSSPAGYFPSGGRYNPTTNSWSTISVTNMPTPRNRIQSSAVWTGTDMIIFGGFNGAALLDGARYTPQPGTGGVWNTLPASGLEARYMHSATWTGTEMIVFGGSNGTTAFSNGARWNPTSGAWTALAAGPTARYLHTAVWTGTGLLVWGGNTHGASAPYGNGAEYSPANQNWTEMGSSGAPAARFQHNAVWSGKEMFVWGGSTSSANALVYTNTGASYNPVSGTWTSMTLNGAPAARIQPLMAWTGLELLIYGGSNGAAIGSGARYRAGQTFYLYQRP